MKDASIIKKPWGKENILVKGPYVVKELHIKRGKKTSYHYHRQKTDTIIVLQGRAKVEYKTSIKELQFHDTLHIPALTMHSIEALGDEDCIIYEVSTPELDDIVRLTDYYKRTEVKIK